MTIYNIKMSEYVYDLTKDYLREKVAYLDDPADIIELVHILDAWDKQIEEQDQETAEDIRRTMSLEDFINKLCEDFPEQEEKIKKLYLKYLKGEVIDEEKSDNKRKDDA